MGWQANECSVTIMHREELPVTCYARVPVLARGTGPRMFLQWHRSPHRRCARDSVRSMLQHRQRLPAMPGLASRVLIGSPWPSSPSQHARGASAAALCDPSPSCAGMENSSWAGTGSASPLALPTSPMGNRANRSICAPSRADAAICNEVLGLAAPVRYAANRTGYANLAGAMGLESLFRSSSPISTPNRPPPTLTSSARPRSSTWTRRGALRSPIETAPGR